MARARSTASPKTKVAKSYKHPESESPMRPEVGTQSEFKKKLPPKKYRYDDSLSPVLEWDGQNAARERGEARIAKAEVELSEARKKLNGKPETKDAAAHVVVAQKAVSELKAMSKPFLNWSGKAERLSFDVPTLPLFIHERLSTKAILETLKGHKRDKQTDMFDLFGDPQHSITDQVLRAYEHRDKWVNRMILGDSLIVMNSLLHYENLGGQVQMIFIDPPYGVRFGSNFQPFVRTRDVSHNDDEDMTREPEMVQAYRDTWELGIHSYLTYLRDRMLLARDLLSPSGSVFVQISDENIHHVRELMDEVFGAGNSVAIIDFVKTSGLAAADALATSCDYLLWYQRQPEWKRVEKLVATYLRSKGVPTKWVGTCRSAFDCVTAKGLRIEVKSARWQSRRRCWTVSIQRAGRMTEGDVDFYVLSLAGHPALGFSKKHKRLYVIVRSPIRQRQVVITLHRLLSKWKDAVGAWSLVIDEEKRRRRTWQSEKRRSRSSLCN